MKVNVVTLGCAKNLVDSEKLLRQLKENGHTLLHDSEEKADAVIVNTCGFILDAKTESVDTVLSWVEAKKRGDIDMLIVMGCLSERYSASLKHEIPEVDGFFGVNHHQDVLNVLGGRYYAGLLAERVLTTPSHYAYLKVSEGCNRQCAFCAIPAIRGKQKSVPIAELVEEATFLAGSGVKELLLIAQDLTSYGTDLYDKKALPELIEKLTAVSGIEWIRLHYTYPHGFPVDEIISLMKSHPKICRYLDIPV
ncbi:MAG TPA: radical SAM protein, partial [Bacteroidales bacterium]|nr:radical SAM protein [Bacteroidales bacterium]